MPGSTRLGAAVSLLSIIYKFEDFKCDDIYVGYVDAFGKTVFGKTFGRLRLWSATPLVGYAFGRLLKSLWSATTSPLTSDA